MEKINGAQLCLTHTLLKVQSSAMGASHCPWFGYTDQRARHTIAIAVEYSYYLFKAVTDKHAHRKYIWLVVSIFAVLHDPLLTTRVATSLKSLNFMLILEILEKSLNFCENFGRSLNFENDP